MIRKEILLQNNLFYNESLMPAEDYDLWTKIVRFGKVYNFRDVLLKYRVHGLNISTKPGCNEQIESLIKSQKEYIAYFFQDLHLSEKEISLLHLMFHCEKLNHSLTINTIEELIKVIKKIELRGEKLNENTKVFLRQYFFYLCTSSTFLGLKLWDMYMKSGLRQAASRVQEIKFFLKSLIRYKPKLNVS